jgi:FlaA1/EpsC-like NDP-sugar epimerase
MRTRILNWPRTTKRLLVIVLDVLLALLATWIAFSLRFDAPNMPRGNQWILYGLTPAIAVPIFARFGLYRAIFRYTGLAAFGATAKAVAVYGAALFAVVLVLQARGFDNLPRTVAILQPILFGVLVGASRASARVIFSDRRRAVRRLLVYGAGRAGIETAAAVGSSREFALVGFIDDDPVKVGRTINEARVYAPADLPVLVERLGISDILLAMPSASRQRRNEVIASLSALPVHVRTIPGVEALASGRVTVQDIRELDVEDLLSRTPVQPDEALLSRNTVGRTVLVTGAGGSIGAELCRQVLRGMPRRLVLLDHNEYGLYTIHADLSSLAQQVAPDCEIIPVLGDVRRARRMVQLCRRWQPHTVYHAAAYKHVPMVEGNVAEGVSVNVFGTLAMAFAAMASDAEFFVLVSTDKAVRPTNAMGASKRVAEMVLQALAASAHPEAPAWVGLSAPCANHTRFVMVRFGNVLGSSGSVVPLFRRQIAGGGPVTVTHPEVTRYFMTIPEAAQLVVQAGAMAEGGEVFVLDMGDPVRIMDLARRMVRLSGLALRDAENPHGDIDIVISGLRPGEKLYEELLIGDDPQPTLHRRIMRAREMFLGWEQLHPTLLDLQAAVDREDEDAVRVLLQQLVPGANLGTGAGQALGPT